MKFFKRLFSKNKDNIDELLTSKRDVEAETFDKEWVTAISFFKEYVEIPINNFVLKDPETHLETPPHIGLEETFDTWKNIKSPWDKRCVLFDCIVDFLQDQMTLWQIANYYTYTRIPHKALEVLLIEQENDKDIINNPNHAMANAKALFSLTRLEEATTWAQKAVELSPNNHVYKTYLADILHFKGEHNQAHKLYNEILDLDDLRDDALSPEELFTNIFSIKSSKFPSLIMAINFLTSLKSKEDTDSFWELIENEFYHIPFCRLEHTYYLLENGEVQKALAKILALTDEMKWVKEAHINALQIIDKLDPSGENLAQYRYPVEKRIKENNWTSENMIARVIDY